MKAGLRTSWAMAALLAGFSWAEAQNTPGIRGVTRRSITSPGIGVAAVVPLANTNAPLATAPAGAPAVSRFVVRATPPPPDPVALDRRVLVFQIKRAAAGSATAQFDLGKRFLEGDGVPKNEKLARQWLQSAADLGNSQAKKALERMGNPPAASTPGPDRAEPRQDAPDSSKGD